MGSGFVFFIRMFIPNVGNPSFVTFFFQILSLILLYSTKSHKTLFKGNFIIFLIYFIFILFSSIYFVLWNIEPGNRLIDIAYISVSIVYLLFLHKIDYSISKNLLIGILILSFIINLSVVYASFTDPNFGIGMRATVNFSKTQEFSGNPHVYAKNGLTSIIISLLFLFKSKIKNFGAYIFFWICLFTGIAIMFLTLVKTAILISPFVVILFLFTFLINKNQHSIPLEKENSTFNLKPILSLGLILFILSFFYTNYLKDIIDSYGTIAVRFVSKSINTILGNAEGSLGFDSSTYTRVENLQKLKNLLLDHPYYFIFGNGYRFYYVDVPIAEVFMNFGIIGLFIFVTYLVIIYTFSIKNIFMSTDMFQIFLSIYILSTFLSTFTQGRPLDYNFFIHSSFYIRFLGVNSFTNQHETTRLS